jgi:hypothetical protein
MTLDLLPRVRELRHDGLGDLSQYDIALRALAAAKDLSEVVEIADKAAALKEYARRAHDRTAEIDAAELRVRAERRLGEIIIKHEGGRPKNAGARGVGKSGVPSAHPTLTDMGIDKKLSSHAQKVARIETPKFEKNLENWRKVATSSTSMRGVRLPFARGASKKPDRTGLTEYLRHDGTALPELQMRQLACIAKVIDAILSRRIGYDARSKVKDLFGTAQVLEFIAAAEGKAS